MKVAHLIVFAFPWLIACSIDQRETMPQTSPPPTSPAPTAPVPSGPLPEAEPPRQLPPISAEKSAPQTLAQMVAADDVAAVRALIASGQKGELTRIQTDGSVLLHHARSAEMVELLWPIDVDLGIVRQGRITARQWRPAWLSPDVNGDLPMHAMAARGDNAAITQALKYLCSWYHRFDVNLADREGRTILHRAIQSRDLLTMDALIHCGWVDLGARDFKGRSALHYAVLQPDFVMGWMLLQNENHLKPGLVWNLPDRSGEMPLALAERVGNKIALTLLTQHVAAQKRTK